MNSNLKKIYFSKFVLILVVGYFCTLVAAFFVAKRQAVVEQKVREQQLINTITEKKDKILLFYVLEDLAKIEDQVKVIAHENPDFLICPDTHLDPMNCAHAGVYSHPSNPNLKLRFQLRDSVRLRLLLAGIISWPNIIILLFVTMLGLLSHRFIDRYVLSPLDGVSEFFKGFAQMRDADRRLSLPAEVAEWKILEAAVNEMLSRIRLLEAELISNTKFEIARQVAHDIRSPLTALNLVSSSLDAIPDEKRILLRSATQRINDIANSLLVRPDRGGKAPGSLTAMARPADVQCEMIAPLVESVVSEKRVQIKNESRIRFDVHLEHAYGVFSQVNVVEFKRALSNLLNNAMESGDGQRDLTVGIHLARVGNRAILTFTDTGKGMRPEVLNRVGQREFSYGKLPGQSGNGLGVFQARSTIERIGGQLRIESEFGTGTKVTVDLPLAAPPVWYADGIRIPQGGWVVSLDDDESIHQAWSQRFRTVHEGRLEVNHLSFLSAMAFENWARGESLERVQYFFVDFELSGQESTGLDLVERLLAKVPEVRGRIVLVSSRHEEQPIKARCERLGVKILPKAMVPQIPVGVA